MQTSRRLWIATAALAIVTAPFCAVAQQSGVATQADKIYDEGTKALDAKNYEVACPKLETAIEMMPEAIGGRITLGQCYENWGELARAWTVYTKAEAMAADAGQTERVRKVAEKIATLRTRIGLLTLDVPLDLRELPGHRITLDGAALREAQWGQPIAVNPGDHTLLATATGYQPHSVGLHVSKGEPVLKVSVPTLIPLALPSATSSTNTVVPKDNTVVPKDNTVVPKDNTVASASSPRSKLPAFVMGGIGVVGLIVGGAMVGVASGTSADIESKLPRNANGTSRCTHDAQAGEDAICADLRASAQSGSTLGNAGIGVLVGGGVLVAAGVAYLLLPLKQTRATACHFSGVFPVVGSNGGGVVWTGSF